MEQSVLSKKSTQEILACVAGGIVRVRGKILTAESGGWPSREGMERSRFEIFAARFSRLRRENWRLRRHCLTHDNIPPATQAKEIRILTIDVQT